MARETRSTELVVGITGPIGSGVTTTSRAFEKKGFRRLSLSEPIKTMLRDECNLAPDCPIDEKTVPDFRKRLQDFGNEGRQKSASHWVEQALKGFRHGKDELVIDGIRNLSEVQALRQRFSKFFLIALQASADVRWKRSAALYNKNFMAFERDDARDGDDDAKEGQQVSKCVGVADYVILNEADHGSIDAQQVNIFSDIAGDVTLMREVDKPAAGPELFRRPPSDQEAHMATAYAQSHLSQCLKRHVGAVIVGENGLGLSIGFNENPIGMKPCTHEFGHCFKDVQMDKKLESLAEFFCPGCGRKLPAIRSPWRCPSPECRLNIKSKFFSSRNMELCTAIHAEERAIRSLAGRSAKDGTIYVTTFPCFQCARYIVDAGLKAVVYVEAYPVSESAKFLKDNRVDVVPFEGFKARAFNLIFKQVA